MTTEPCRRCGQLKLEVASLSRQLRLAKTPDAAERDRLKAELETLTATVKRQRVLLGKKASVKHQAFHRKGG